MSISVYTRCVCNTLFWVHITCVGVKYCALWFPYDVAIAMYVCLVSVSSVFAVLDYFVVIVKV